MTGKKTYMKKDEVPVFLKKVSYTLVFCDGGRIVLWILHDTSPQRLQP